MPMPIKVRITLIAVVLAIAAMASRRAFADTYQLKAATSTQSETFYAGDDFGNYTINLEDKVVEIPNFSCGGVINPPSCYETHYINRATNLLTVAPPPLWNDPDPIAGPDPCKVDTSAGFHPLSVLCGNGHIIFAGFYDKPDGSEVRGIWTGSDPNPVLDYIGNGSIDGGFMTANGNAYFIDGLHDTLDVALDLSTVPAPEPGSLLLFGSGISFLLALMRRRAAPVQGSFPERSSCNATVPG
jgi:hypothetical protein